MNEHVTNLLAEQLITLPFVTKAAGVIQLLKLPKTDGKAQIVPVVKGVFRKDGYTEICENEDPYLDVLPNSAETGIIYFEDLGAKRKNINNYISQITGRLKLVAWFDFKKIGGTITLTDLQQAVLATLANYQIPSSSYISSAVLEVEAIDPKRPDPFDKFGLDESNVQYITHPFDYFSLTIYYVANVSSMCVPEIELNPETC